MPLSPSDRATFQDLMSALGDDADPRPMLGFARAHRDHLLEELVALPGVSRVRAGVLRLLPELVPDAETRADLARQAGSAILAPVGPGPMERLARHPAWVGLAVLELAELRDDWEGDPVDRASEIAGRAFAAAGTPETVGKGEVLWALAEEAEEAGWLTRAHALLERAAKADFADDARRAQVLLLVAIRRLARDEDALELLSDAAETEAAEGRTRTHAAWILAHTHPDVEAAARWLGRAAEWVDRDDDPDVARRIDAALAARNRP